MKRTLFSIAAILCASLVFFSCSKDNNTVVDAQALTTVFEVKNSDWQTSSVVSGYEVTFDMTEITASITDQGAVWVYYSFDNGISYELAPSLQRTDASGNTFDFLGQAGTDNQGGYVVLTALKYTGNSNQAPKFSNPNIVVKVVSIPSSLYQANKNVNKEDFNEVKRVFNLK
ncbi:hypothetical protein SAMN05192529_108162 [Arachidicoccus rhizosphaerae]|uniref:Uncharacterized protein n=1 Tax=Arachidicoccus rhizosphaerae TaxID=551991 RepID=A0A1H3YLN6_9BACT|nr:hypothetical protein [Arachidicoccus rhizosphaerae]SEA12465.1 hypothetical protein SAMN05192529_108162 [Arachidicoccus rhizosphaerae]